MRRAVHTEGQAGFSLIEMMIATAIFILLCAAAFALLTLAQQRYQTESQVLNSFQEARFGLDEIVRDVNGAGFPPQDLFSFSNSRPPDATLFASTPVAWDPNYQANAPCQIGTAGGGTCTTPTDFDIIIERDVDPWRHDGVEWTRYQLAGNILSRGQTYKVPNASPDATTAPSFVPYVQNVMNNASATQITDFQKAYPQMFPGGKPVPVFTYFCPNPTPPPQIVPCTSPLAGANNSPVNVTDVEITLIVMAPNVDAQTGAPRLIELHGRGHTLNPAQ